MDLTIGMPGIRPNRWKNVYESVDFSGSWEMIIVSPYDLPEDLKHKKNIRIIKDFGSPTRCQQITLIEAKGRHYSWMADDAVFYKGAIDKAFNLIKDKPYRTVIMGRYTEIADGDNKKNPNFLFMQTKDYYYLKLHLNNRIRHLPSNYLLFNAGIIPTQLLKEVGGWDCNFEVGGMCFVDLSIRLQNFGIEVIDLESVYLECGHMPGRSGDHGPVHDGQTQHDDKLFDYIYSNVDSINRVFIDLNNWENAPKIWTRRFPTT